MRPCLTHEGKFMLYLYVFEWMPEMYEDIHAMVVAENEDQATDMVKEILVRKQLAGNTDIPYLYPVDTEGDCLTITRYDITKVGLIAIGINYRD